MMKVLVLVGVLVLLGLSCATVSSNDSWTPLPEPGTISSVKIVPPGLDVLPQIAAYSGKWEGKWNNGRWVTIIIEKIEPPDVVAIYSWGLLGDTKGGWTRVLGQIEKDSVALRWGGRTVILTSTADKNTANAEYRRVEVLYAVLRKN